MLLTILAYIGGIWYTCVILVCMLGTTTIFLKYKKAQPSMLEEDDESPGVSILRPLKGIEDEQYACLESAFLQRYKNFEVIMSVADGADAVVGMARQVMAQHGEVPSRLVVGTPRGPTGGRGAAGANPKINNLVEAFAQARHDIVWILDANVWVGAGTLGRSVAALRRAALVHHLPLGVCVAREAQFAAQLEAMYLATAHGKMYVAINAVGVAPCVVGKSNLFRRSDLLAAAPAGLAGFARFAAEDQLVAAALWRSGGRHVLAGDCAWQPWQECGGGGGGYCARRVRWLRVRKFVVPAATLVEPLTESAVCGAVGAAVAAWGWGWRFWAVWALHMAAWGCGDYVQFCHLHSAAVAGEGRPWGHARLRHTGAVRWAAVWAAREASALPLWLYAMAGTAVRWRDSELRVDSDMTVRRAE